MSLDKELLFGYDRVYDMKSHLLVMGLTVLRSSHYARQSCAVQLRTACPNANFCIALARAARTIERRDEDHFVKVLQSKMDPTTGVQVVGLRLYCAMLTETLLSSLYGGRRVHFSSETFGKLTVPSYSIVSNTIPKPVDIEASYCTGPLLLLCLTFSTTAETYADFQWTWGTKVDSTRTRLPRAPDRPSSFALLDNHFDSLTQGHHTDPSDSSGWEAMPYPDMQCRQGFKEGDIVELRVKMQEDDNSGHLMMGFVDNVSVRPSKHGKDAEFHKIRQLYLWVDSSVWLDTHSYVKEVSMATCIQSGDALKTLGTWSHSFKSCPKSALAVMGEKDIESKAKEISGSPNDAYILEARSLPAALQEYLAENHQFTRALSPLASAVSASCSQCLIPFIGPPGTGKTTVLIELVHLSIELFTKGLWKPNKIPMILVTAWTNAAVHNLIMAAQASGYFTEVVTVCLCGKKEEGTLLTACDHTLCITSKNPEWTSILDARRPVILFSTISKMIVQPTRFQSTVNAITGRIAAIFSDELTQTLRQPMISMLRYQSHFSENASLRCFFGDPRQLPAFARSTWNMYSCMRTVLVAVQPIILSAQYRQVEVLGDMTSWFFYEGKIQTMRSLQGNICPLTVVIWDTEELSEEVRESTLEAALVIKLLDTFPWKCQKEEDIVILTAYKKHAQLLKRHIGQRDKVFGIDATQGMEKDSGIFSCGRHDGETGFLKDRRRMCVGLSRLKNEMIVVLHRSLVSGTVHTWATQFWRQMWETWTRMGVVCDVGHICGRTINIAVEQVITFNRQLRISSKDVAHAVSPSLSFFNKYQISSVGRLNDTTELPESEESDVESEDRQSVQTEPEREDDEGQERMQIPSLQNVSNSALYDDDLLQKHFMCVQMPHADRLWRAFSCVTEIRETQAILDLPDPENWIQIWRGAIKMLAHLLFYYAEAYYRGRVTDLDDWEEVAIQYKQGINTTLGDLLANDKQMEDFLLRLSGNLQNSKGTSMFFSMENKGAHPLHGLPSTCHGKSFCLGNW